MDIQISSNFERLLFELSGRDPARVRTLMAGLAQSGAFTLDVKERADFAALFSADRISEEEALGAIRRVKTETGYTTEPHTVAGIEAARRQRTIIGGAAIQPSTPIVALATAHPAKFPGAINAALGEPPTEPERVARQRLMPERMSVLPNDIAAISDFVSSRTRATRAAS